MRNRTRASRYKGTSDFGSYEVIDELYNDRPARVLYGDDATPQSGTALDEEPELLFNYNQRFLEIILSARPKRLLVIGGGGFMLPTAAFHRIPDLVTDVVEIDPLLVQIARDYFDLPDDKRLGVHVGDGANYVAGTKNTYDMIIVDAFSGTTIPPHLIEYTALQHYKNHLNENGIVALNFISPYQEGKSQLAHAIIGSFREVYSSVSLFQSDPEYPDGENQNYVLVAGEHTRDFDYLQSVELELY